MNYSVKSFRQFMIEQPMGKPEELVTDADRGQNSGFYNPHRWKKPDKLRQDIKPSRVTPKPTRVAGEDGGMRPGFNYTDTA